MRAVFCSVVLALGIETEAVDMTRNSGQRTVIVPGRQA
jgi:hypothetical protein